MKLTNHLRRHYFSITGGPAPEIHSKCSTRYNNYSTITKTINQSPQSKFKCTISILSLGYFTWLTFCWSRVVREEQKNQKSGSNKKPQYHFSYIQYIDRTTRCHSLQFVSLSLALSLWLTVPVICHLFAFYWSWNAKKIPLPTPPPPATGAH